MQNPLSPTGTPRIGASRGVSSPLIPKYSKRRLKKLGNKTILGAKVTEKEKKSQAGGSIAAEKTIHTPDLSDPLNPMNIKDTLEYKQHLIRKIFLPKVPLESQLRDHLPSLTSSEIVDIELYCFIGLLFKNFVNEWYFQITENDEFISEIVAVVSQITRKLESRAKSLDIESLMLDYVPYILDNHRQLYTYCMNNLNSQFVPYNSMNEAFDMMNTHPALSSKFKQETARESGLGMDYNLSINDTFDRFPSAAQELDTIEQNYLQMLSRGALSVLLPKEVQDSNMSRYFIRSVMSNVVLKILTKQLSEPDIIYSILIGALKSREKKEVSESSGHIEGDINTLKGKIVKIFRTLSHFIAYSTSTGSSKDPKKAITRRPISDLYLFQFLNNLFSFSLENPILFLFVEYFSLWFLSYNADQIRNFKLKGQRSGSATKDRANQLHRSSSIRSTRPVISGEHDTQKSSAAKILQNSLSTLVNAHLFAIKINSILYNLFDKLVIQKFVRNEMFISQVIRMARTMIFPTDDKMGPPRKIPNEQELEEMKIELFLLMKKSIPFWFQLLIFNEVGGSISNHDDNDDLESVFEDTDGAVDDVVVSDGLIISSFGSKKGKFRSMIKTKTDFKFYQFIESFRYRKYNKLLVYNLMDHLFMVLFPELQEYSPSVLEGFGSSLK